MTHVYWWNLNPEADATGAWDMGIVEELTAGSEFQHSMWVRWTDGDGAVVVIPGQHNRWTQYAIPIAEFVASLPWALTILTSDEEALFPVELLPHDDKHLIYGQYHARPEFDRVIPIGLPPASRETLDSRPFVPLHAPTHVRDLDVFFAGQNTHARREELIATMKDMACEPGNGNISWVASTGFRAGLDRDGYLACMARTKIAPCPSGYHSLDSFRLYEAIAAGALPVIETSTPDGYEPEFWWTMFGLSPIPMVESWEVLPALTRGWKADDWRALRDEVQRWYADYRASLAADFKSTIARLQS